MYISGTLSTTMVVDKKENLGTFKKIMEALNLKINKSQIARQLDIDRRSVHKYLQGYEKPKTRKRSGYLDNFYDIISELLSSDLQIFHYKRVLWQYLIDNHELSCPQSTFRRYISLRPEFQKYFTKCKPNTKAVPVMRFNTPPGEQAQLDWKENINFITSDGEVVVINVLVLLLSCSRFRVYKLSLTKDETMLQSLLTECFEMLGGVPKILLTDNMKTVMQEARTKYNKGTINKSMAGFPKIKEISDFEFEFQPSINKNEIMDFASLRFIEKKENIIFYGNSGVGKTHLATAIGVISARNRYSTYFIKCSDLMTSLHNAKLQNRLEDKLKKLTSYRVLIIDELGYLPMSKDNASLFFQLIDKRYEKFSTIITTNINFSSWDNIFCDPIIANAILDRLLHHANVVTIKGQSFRLKHLSLEPPQSNKTVHS